MADISYLPEDEGIDIDSFVHVKGDVKLYEEVGLTSLGHHLAAKAPDGHLHFHAHSEFVGGLSTSDTQIIESYDYAIRAVYQPDNSATFVGTNLEFSFLSPSHVLSDNAYYQVGPGGAAEDVTVQIWLGTDDTGFLIFDQTYAAGLFVADTEIELHSAGYVEYDEGATYFLRYSSSGNFSLKANAALTMPWFAVDVSSVREDNLLQTKPWVDGDSWDDGDYFIDSRMIYVCNTTGVQTGTFAGNSDKWDLLGSSDGHSHVELDGDFTEIFNSAGMLKIQPDAQGDVELFGDTDVDNSDNGKMLYIHRRAPEGNNYMRMYITSSKAGMFHSNSDMTFQGQVSFTIRSVTGNIVLQMGDTAGSKEVRFRDKDATTVATMDSNGNFDCDGDATVGSLTSIGNVDVLNSLTVGNDVIVTDDVLIYGDVSARIVEVRSAVVFQDKSTQEEAVERHFSQGHTHTAIYNNDWYDADAESMSERDIHFSPDGLMMYVIGLADSGVGDCSIWEYELTVPWDLSTVGTPTIKNIDTYGNNQVGLFISIDGRRLWTVCTANDTVIEYAMNPWNISALTWVQAKDISGQDSSPSAVFWSANGNRLFVAGDNDNDIVAFSVANEWDISGISWFENFGTDINAPTGLYFSSDGRRMYVMDGSAEDDIHEFHLSLPWRIATARLVNLFDVSSENNSPQGIFLTPDNSKIFMVGTGTPDGVYRYDLGLEAKGTVIASAFKATNLPTSDPVDAGAFWNDSGTIKISSGS
jgi:hypothetical protein